MPLDLPRPSMPSTAIRQPRQPAQPQHQKPAQRPHGSRDADPNEGRVQILLPLVTMPNGTAAGAAMAVAAGFQTPGFTLYNAVLCGNNVENITNGSVSVGGASVNFGFGINYPGQPLGITVDNGFVPIQLGDIEGGTVIAAAGLTGAAGPASLCILAYVDGRNAGLGVACSVPPRRSR